MMLSGVYKKESSSSDVVRSLLESSSSDVVRSSLEREFQ